MSERAAFISAILDNPDDDTARLVFADWLEEHGEPERAEFIRCQIDVARLPEKGRNKTKPAKRAALLLKKHEKQWRAAAGLTECRGAYVRGFLDDVRAVPGDLEGLASALTIEPFTVRLGFGRRPNDPAGTTPAWFGRLAANPVLAAVLTMESLTSGMGHKLFSPLMKSPHLKNLRMIFFFEDYLGPKGVEAIANSPAPFTLQHLDLHSGIGCAGDDEDAETVAAVKLLATHPRFASLKRLGLIANSLGNECINILLTSKTLPRTLHLDLDENNFDEERFAEALAERFRGGSDGEEE